ncbi:MAG: glycosyltransferase family 2 protein [Alistipes sp.]|nr:glycosyltransferase family 2 protein [Alistipes sp.]
MIRLSLVIATYNRAEQLMVTLGSVAMQNAEAESWECIVVDNNSSDNTRERVEAFKSEHNSLNIRYIFEQNQGLSYARNAGIVASRGDIVAFIDDDERIVSDFVSAYIDLFDQHPDAMAAGGEIIAEYPTGRPRWMSRYTERPIANPMSFGDRVKLFPSCRIPGGGNMAMRRRVFDSIGMFNTSLGRTGKRLLGGEESDLFERIVKHEYRVYYAPRAVMYHIIPKEKLSRDYFVRLATNTGISQRTRAELNHTMLKLYVAEVAKWVATLLLCLIHRPAQSRYLILMRKHISKGIFQR